MAGQPPLSSRREASTPRRAANPLSSSAEKRRSSPVRRSSDPSAASRASGTAGADRLASITCPFAGRASIRPASQRAPADPDGSRWASSNTRHTARGLRSHTASATAAGSGSSPSPPPALPPPGPPARASVAPPAGASSAVRVSRARAWPSASAGPRPSHTSSPRGARRFSATAWASSVVLPSPGPPTTVVTRWSQRAMSVRSSRGRVSDPGRGTGGSNRNERDIGSEAKASGAHPSCGTAMTCGFALANHDPSVWAHPAVAPGAAGTGGRPPATHR